jgi:hypothetical protein
MLSRLQRLAAKGWLAEVGSAGHAEKRKLDKSESWITKAGLDGIRDRQIQNAKVQTAKIHSLRRAL